MPEIANKNQMKFITIFATLVSMKLSLVFGDLIGYNRLSGSVNRAVQRQYRRSISEPKSAWDQYVAHFGKTKSRQALQELIKLKRKQYRQSNKHVLFW